MGQNMKFPPKGSPRKGKKKGMAFGALNSLGPKLNVSKEEFIGPGFEPLRGLNVEEWA